MHRKHILFLAVLLIVVVALAACAAPATDDGDVTPAPTETTAATDADATPQSLSWESPPPMSIDPSKIYQATLKTEKGDIVVELYPDKAPETVNNFVFLAEQGFYDNTTFHRVIDGFMAQGGDPTGTGTGGPGYTFADEIDPGMSFDRAGLLAMANSGPGTNGSQFFITFAPATWLDGQHTIFGEVISGADVLNQLTRRDPEENPDFSGDLLLGVEINEVADSQRPTPTLTPTPFAPDLTASDHFMADMPMEERIDYWNMPPATALDPATNYIATIRTEVGDITVELMPSLAPQNVANFIALAQAGYYDGTHFFQVLSDLVAVGGDPLDNGEGSPGYVLPDELSPDAFGEPGWLGSAATSPDRNSGQFFFSLGEAPWLSDRFTAMGRIIEGLDVLAKLQLRDPAESPPWPGTLIQSVDISTADTSRLPTPTPTPEPNSPTLPPTGERPLSSMSAAQRNEYYNTAPEMQIDPTQDYVAVIHTDVGDITIDLFEDQTPNTINNFVVLALNGFYDDTTFHRVIEDFMAQAGDPTGTGAGGPGYAFEDEIVNELRHDRAGLVSMANAGPNTNGSQFFITFEPTPWLDDMHTIFGEVTEGMDVVSKIQFRDPETATEPGTRIQSIDIETK